MKMFSLKQIVKFSNYGLVSKRSVSNATVPLVDLKVDTEGIAVLTLQRLPVNSLNLELMTEIGDALDKAEKNELKGVIMTSAIPSIYSAGMDIKEMYKPDVSRLAEVWKATRRITSQLLHSGYIVTTAITGHVSAGGCILALATDYRVMVDGNYTIGLNDTMLDIVPPKWVFEAMKHVMGSRNAELALTASTLFSPLQAKEAGLIDDIASSKEDAIDKCKKFIEQYDDIVPEARVKTKLLLKMNILEIWAAEHKNDHLESYIATVMSPERQKALEPYLEALKNKKKLK